MEEIGDEDVITLSKQAWSYIRARGGVDAARPRRDAGHDGGDRVAGRPGAWLVTGSDGAPTALPGWSACPPPRRAARVRAPTPAPSTQDGERCSPRRRGPNSPGRDCQDLIRTCASGCFLYTDRALPAVLPTSFQIDGSHLLFLAPPQFKIAHAQVFSFHFQADDAAWTVTAHGPVDLQDPTASRPDAAADSERPRPFPIDPNEPLVLKIQLLVEHRHRRQTPTRWAAQPGLRGLNGGGGAPYWPHLATTSNKHRRHGRRLGVRALAKRGRAVTTSLLVVAGALSQATLGAIMYTFGYHRGSRRRPPQRVRVPLPRREHPAFSTAGPRRPRP